MSDALYKRERILITDTAKQIRALTAKSTYDHRKQVHQVWFDGNIIPSDESELLQGRLVWAIGQVLRPLVVYEVGVGPGITALALVESCGAIDYTGVDNAPTSRFLRPEFDLPVGVAATIQRVRERNSNGTTVWDTRDSDILDKFEHAKGKKIDLIHIDGDHEFEHQRRDVEKAIRSGAEWLLVDDCNDTEVVTSCFAAWKNEWNKAWRGGLLPFIYFEDAPTGSMLFHLNMWGHL